MTQVNLGMPDLMPPVSNSEIQTWLDCRRKWFLVFYLEKGPKREALTGPLRLGTMVHECLERRYANGEDLIEVYEELYTHSVYLLLTQEAERGFIDYELRKKMQQDRELAHAMLEGYAAWVEETGNDEGYTLAGAEIVVEVAFEAVPGTRIRGKLDQRIYREIDSARLFRDFKTAANLKDGPQMLPIDEQMKFYMMLERLDALAKSGDLPPEPTMGGLYLMLRKVKRTARAQPPFYAQVEVHHNELEMESMYLRTQKRLEEMVAARQALDAGGDHRYEVYPHPTRDCSWKCEYLPVCPMMDDSTEQTWKALLDAHYVDTDPYERYAEDENKS